MQVAVLTDIHATCPRSKPCSRRSSEAGVERALVPRRRGRLRRPARRLRRARRERCDLSLVGNHDLAVLGRDRHRRLLGRRRGRRRVDPGATAPRRRWSSSGPRARGDRPGGRPLPRLTARPDLGVRAGRRPGRPCMEAQSAAGQPDRPLPRRALLLRSGEGDAGEPRGQAAPRATSSTSARAAGCSTPAASASRATATRAPPGWSSTPTQWKATYHRVEYDIDRAADAIRGRRPAGPLADRL